MAEHFYVEIQHAVPAEVEMAVLKATRYAMRVHRIRGPVKVKFFLRTADAAQVARWPSHTFMDYSVGDARLLGRVHSTIDPNTIWVNVDQSPKDAARTALHEVTHVLELQSPNGKSAEWWEQYAQRFSKEHIARSHK